MHIHVYLVSTIQSGRVVYICETIPSEYSEFDAIVPFKAARVLLHIVKDGAHIRSLQRVEASLSDVL